MSRARYGYERHGSIIFIVDFDLPGCKSVTNDADKVIDDLVERGIKVDAFAIVYRDSMGRWDRLHTEKGKFAGFRPLNPALKGVVTLMLQNKGISDG